MKAKKPLKVVGWLGSAGYQTVIVKADKTSTKTTGKSVRPRQAAKAKKK